MINILLAACNNPFGCITPPVVGPLSDPVTGLIPFMNRILILMVTVAGIYAFFNIIIAGYGFLGAGGDVKKIASAWDKIWQSALGLVIVAGSFVLAAILGWLIFHDPTAILSPKIYGAP